MKKILSTCAMCIGLVCMITFLGIALTPADFGGDTTKNVSVKDAEQKKAKTGEEPAEEVSAKPDKQFTKIDDLPSQPWPGQVESAQLSSLNSDLKISPYIL